MDALPLPPQPDPFEDAADAVVNGDLAALERHLPGLIRARSKRVHHATLLHYVAANGVEDYRQLTPPNAVAIATGLLEAGAEVDAIADTYGGGNAQTTMNLLVSSAHPAAAGLQSALVEVLLDHGAAIDGLDDDSSPLMTAIGFWYGDAAETLARRGARIDNVVAAAAVGREDLVRRFVGEPARPVRTEWLKLPADLNGQIGVALVWAIKFGHRAIEAFLLDRADVTVGDPDGMTALHWAAANGRIDLIDELLGRGASLDALNQWEGDVYSSTAYFAEHMPRPGVDYAAVLEHLRISTSN